MEETPKAAAAFHEYCLMGPGRSLRKLEAKIGTKLSQLDSWSSHNGWQQRIKEYDAEVAQERQRRREQLIDEMNREQSEQGRVLRNKSYERILELLKAPRVSLYALSQILRISIDMERDSIEGDELSRKVEALEQLMKERTTHE